MAGHLTASRAGSYVAGNRLPVVGKLASGRRPVSGTRTRPGGRSAARPSPGPGPARSTLAALEPRTASPGGDQRPQPPRLPVRSRRCGARRRDRGLRDVAAGRLRRRRRRRRQRRHQMSLLELLRAGGRAETRRASGSPISSRSGTPRTRPRSSSLRAGRGLPGRHQAADGVRRRRRAGHLHHQPRRLPPLLQRRRACRTSPRTWSRRRSTTSSRSVLASRMVDGKVYGLPMEVEPMAMYYSVDGLGGGRADRGRHPPDLGPAARGRRAADHRPALRRALRDDPRLLPELHLVPVHVAGRRRVRSARTARARLRSPATVQALKFWQDAVNMGVAPRKLLGGGGGDVAANLGRRLLRDAERRHLGDLATSTRTRPTSSTASSSCRCRRAAPTPPTCGGWAFVANAQGKNPEAAAQFCVWALGSMSEDSIQRASTGARWPRATCRRASRSSRAAGAGWLRRGRAEASSPRRSCPGGRAEPRVPPEVYKAISDAIQAASSNGADPARRRQTRRPADRGFLPTYQGAPIL